MNLLAHREDCAGWRMRHPVVCLIDIVGFATMLILVLIYEPKFTAAALPLTITLQYAVSCLHHWKRYSEWRSKLDRSVIFLVIGATYIPYWGGLLPLEEALVRLPLVGLSTALGITLLLTGASNKSVGVYWAVFASAGLVVSFYELQEWLPSRALALFWVGSALYGLQQIIYTFKLADFAPGLFGYRESQHLLLLVATITGSVVALEYT